MPYSFPTFRKAYPVRPECAKPAVLPFTFSPIWIGIALISGAAALAGFGLFSHFSDDVIAATTATAAGAILAMLVDTMIPEAFAEAHNFAGIITVLGFLAAFVLSKLSGT